jgi:hypothetical protein
MRAWGFDGREFVSLHTLAIAFGLAGKVKEVDGIAIEGKTFYLAWRNPELRPIAEKYLGRDLELPAVLAVKMGVV